MPRSWASAAAPSSACRRPSQSSAAPRRTRRLRPRARRHRRRSAPPSTTRSRPIPRLCAHRSCSGAPVADVPHPRRARVAPPQDGVVLHGALENDDLRRVPPALLDDEVHDDDDGAAHSAQFARRASRSLSRPPRLLRSRRLHPAASPSASSARPTCSSSTRLVRLHGGHGDPGLLLLPQPEEPPALPRVGEGVGRLRRSEAGGVAALMGKYGPAKTLRIAKGSFRGSASARSARPTSTKRHAGSSRPRRSSRASGPSTPSSPLWKDPAKPKWAAIRRWASTFHAKHNRMPVLWLDKACIDQSRIEERWRCSPLPSGAASCWWWRGRATATGWWALLSARSPKIRPPHTTGLPARCVRRFTLLRMGGTVGISSSPPPRAR